MYKKAAVLIEQLNQNTENLLKERENLYNQIGTVLQSHSEVTKEYLSANFIVKLLFYNSYRKKVKIMLNLLNASYQLIDKINLKVRQADTVKNQLNEELKNNLKFYLQV